MALMSDSLRFQHWLYFVLGELLWANSFNLSEPQFPNLKVKLCSIVPLPSCWEDGQDE